jgi:hypothetical protein
MYFLYFLDMRSSRCRVLAVSLRRKPSCSLSGPNAGVVDDLPFCRVNQRLGCPEADMHGLVVQQPGPASFFHQGGADRDRRWAVVIVRDVLRPEVVRKVEPPVTQSKLTAKGPAVKPKGSYGAIYWRCRVCLRGPLWFIRAVSRKAIKRTRSFTEFARSFTESIFAIGGTRCVDLYLGGHTGDLLIGPYSGMISSSTL